MASNTQVSYSVAQRSIHWLMALLIFFNLIFSDGMEKWSRAVRDGGTADADVVGSANIHAYVGIAVLALALIRLAFRLVQGAPAAPADEPPVAKLLSTLAHGTFDILFFIMPLAGIGAYYFGNETAGFLHGGPLKLILWVLIVAHVGAALIHHFYWKTDVLKRMTSGVKA
ncbi:cytochrome b [Rhizobium sp. PAMB 3174]